MHDDSTTTTLSDDAASAAPIVGKIAPVAGKTTSATSGAVMPAATGGAK
jgi:hypothetical protein